MKFLIVLALVAVASANLNYGGSYGGSRHLSSRSSYGSGLSGLSLGGGYGSGLSGGYSSGLSLGGGYGSGLSLGGGYGSGLGLGNAKLALIQAVPVGIATQQVGLGLGSLGGASYGGSLGGSFGGSYGGGSYSSAQVSGPITAAIHSTRNVQVVDVASNQQLAAPAQIVIGPSVQPIDIEFQSQSSPVNVRQTHIPGQANAPQSSSHQEEPDYLRQEIVKPVIHEVTEAIQPYRKITQEVRPVLETINQLITRGQQQQQVASVGVQNLGASQFVAAQPTVAVAAQPTLALVTAAQPVSVGLTGSSLGYGGSLGYGSSLGSLSGGSSLGYGSSLGSLSGGSSLGYGGSSLGYGSSLGGSSLGSSFGSLSGSTLVSKPSVSSVSVDNYRRA